ncbi:MAG: hypothetical protein QM669_10620 [Siphonobacter sp.]
MKRILYFLCLITIYSSALAQEVPEIPEYYNPQKTTVIRAQPLQMKQRRGILPSSERWYISLEGFTRKDVNQLSNTIDGLITTNPGNKAGWGATVGVVLKDVWNVELGYMNSPIHNPLVILSDPVYQFNYKNESNAAVLRLKRQVVSTGRTKNQSGFWISVGGWLVPNSGKIIDAFQLYGYSYSNQFQTVPDTLRLYSQTQTSKQITGMVEAAVEYNVRISNRFDLGFYYRHYWGLGTSLSTDLRLTENSTNDQTARITADGTGWSLGLAIRYTYSLKRKNLSAYELRGKD